jgi:hypothetical protein
MQREVVFVPTYHRSAFLWCCLEAIRKAEPDIQIIVQPDRGTEELEVCNRFRAEQRFVTKHTYHGNSFNMMEGLRYCCEAGYDRVFVVEDDCIVDPTFFGWARNALDNPKPWMGAPFAASGWMYSPDMPDEEGPDVLLNWYLSVCSAIPRRSLERITVHAQHNYYVNMKKYVDETFPRDPQVGTMHYEQDGLILRIANSAGERFAWPRKPRALHLGWTGYHMPHGKMPQAELRKQVLVVKMAIENPEILRQLMAGSEPPAVGECRSCGRALVSTNKKAAMVCVGCFHKQNPNAPIAAKSHYYIKRSEEAQP